MRFISKFTVLQMGIIPHFGLADLIFLDPRRATGLQRICGIWKV